MKHNAINDYKHNLELVKNPVGTTVQEKDIVRARAKKAVEDWENRFKTSRKYKDDPEIKELLKDKEEPKEETKPEVKQSGKGRNKSA